LKRFAPEAIREARGPAFNRPGVKGSLSAISSLIASSVTRCEALPEIMVANGELPRLNHLRFAAQAMIAGAVIGRNPATMPMPAANE